MSRRGRNFRRVDQRVRDARSAVVAPLGSTKRDPPKALLREQGKKAYEEWLRRKPGARP